MLRVAGLGIRAAARKLGSAAWTLSRKLRCNALQRGSVSYRPVHADGSYLTRRQRQAVLELDERLRDFVING